MMTNKEQLIKDIQDFVGEGGYVAFEHGYNPTMAIYGVAYNYVDRTMASGKWRQGYFHEMSEEELTNIILELFRYMNYCQLYA